MGGVLAALAWVLFLMATYSPLSDLAIQVVIGVIVAYYYLLFGLKWGLMLAFTIGILTSFQPGIPLNLALILYFMPWPLIKGFIEARIYHQGNAENKIEEKRCNIKSWVLKWLFATLLFVLAYFLLQTMFMETLSVLRARFESLLVPWLGEMAAAGPVLLIYLSFLVFTFLYEQVLIFGMRALGGP